MHARLAHWIAGIALAGGVASEGAWAQTTDDLFDASKLHEIRLSINSRDLTQLRAQYDQNTFYPADLVWRGIRVRNVGVRSRGFGSRNPVKLGLTIEMDRYTSGQQFLGLSSLVLDNLWQDPSMLRQFLAMGFLRRTGLAAPRESFTRVYINNTYQGLYAIVEDIDAAFVARWTGDAEGTLFEYHWRFPYSGEDLKELSAYAAIFEPRTHVRDPVTTLWGPIQDLFQSVNDPDDATWRSRVDRFLDLEQFVTQAAVENYVAENDGLLGYAGMDNFYLYRPSGDTRHRVFPRDKDNAFLQPDFAPFEGVDANHVMRRALAEPDLRALHASVLARCAEVDRNEQWLRAEVERAVAVIRAAAHADPLKPVGNDQFDAAADELRDFGRRCSEFVTQSMLRLFEPQVSSFRLPVDLTSSGRQSERGGNGELALAL